MYPLFRQLGSRIHYLNAISPFCACIWQFMLVFILSNTISASKAYGVDESEAELINFAFANYLGTGFYTSGGGDVFILRVPLSTTLRPMTSNDPGWVITYPMTFGIANIDQIIDGETPTLDNVGTISIIPGVEYHYPVLYNWRLIPFFDLGIARDLANNVNIRVLGTGAKSYVTFDFDRNRLTLGNRFLYADQKNLDKPRHSNFAVFETALDYNIPTDWIIHGSYIDIGFYYINYYYLKDLVFIDTLEKAISLENKNEIGFTFSVPDYSWLPENTRLGFGVQITKDTNLYRIVFGMPFF